MPSSDALSFEAQEERERERNKKEFEIAKTTEAIFMNERTNGQQQVVITTTLAPHAKVKAENCQMGERGENSGGRFSICLKQCRFHVRFCASSPLSLVSLLCAFICGSVCSFRPPADTFSNVWPLNAKIPVMLIPTSFFASSIPVNSEANLRFKFYSSPVKLELTQENSSFSDMSQDLT